MEPLHILEDPSFCVPAVPTDCPPGTVGWLRASVARFSEGAAHERRRDLATAALATAPPDLLRREAAARATAGNTDRLAVDVLAAALGVTADVFPAVAAIAAVYQPHTGGYPGAADTAVAALVEIFGGTCDEATAARIGLLVQACDATAALIREAHAGAAPADAAPVPATRRVSPVDGSTVVVPLAASGLPFGAGRHACPGRAHALAIAEGACHAG